MAYLSINLETEEFYISWGEGESSKPVNYIKIADTLGKLNAGGKYIEQIKYAILNFGMENIETEHARSLQLIEWVAAFTYKNSNGQYPSTEDEIEGEIEVDDNSQSPPKEDRIFVEPDKSFDGTEEEDDHF